MISKGRFILLLILVFIVWKTLEYLTEFPKGVEIPSQFFRDPHVNNDQKIKLSVYYEALCSDSRNFIIKQLVPTYKLLGESILLDLVPYGKATTFDDNTDIIFKCQHGATECLANKIHACALNQVSDPELRLNYVACMIKDNLIPHDIGRKCAEELGLQYDLISECADGREGSLLLKAHGVATQSVTPMITFIPTVQTDGSQSVPLVQLLKNLHGELCGLFSIRPKGC